MIESVVRSHPTLRFHVNSGNEHCVELFGRERKGSLWITPRYSGYRLQTTGQAQSIDRDIERLCGQPEGAQKAQMYKFWYIDEAASVEKIIGIFAKI